MKKVLYGILILAIIGGIAKSCESCSGSNNKSPEGTYYYSSGNENGKIVVDKNKDFVITGRMGYTDVYYTGGIDSQNKLRIRGGDIPTNMLGMEFGEWDGDEIVSGGWTFKKK
ncbi:MAG: hypothetical protein IJ764_02590 [Bacteroidales bacterium]|nr:hypothetical protein [Bacteroidales bacterium]